MSSSSYLPVSLLQQQQNNAPAGVGDNTKNKNPSLPLSSSSSSSSSPSSPTPSFLSSRSSSNSLSDSERNFCHNNKRIGRRQSSAERLYGSISMDDEENEEDMISSHALDGIAGQGNRRWSIFEKLDGSSHRRIGNCRDCCRILNCKCFFATLMLGTFVALALTFAHAVFTNNANAGSDVEYWGGFDFIVIGGGPAGSVLTRRLVDEGASVLLLEAGIGTQYDLGGSDYFGGPVTRFDIPFLWSSVTQFPDFHWDGFNIRGLLIAKGLGGCGVHNAMLYVRAVAADLAKWNILGLSWDVLLNKYLELENYIAAEDEASIPWYHGTDGIIPTTRSAYLDQIAPEFVSSAVHVGIKYSADFNHPNGREGVGYYHFNINNGIRSGAVKEMLGPLITDKRKNLAIELKAVVRKVILAPIILSNNNFLNGDKSNNGGNDNNRMPPSSKDPISGNGNQQPRYKAIGVEYEQDGRIKTAYIKGSLLGMHSIFTNERSVIVTAGAIMTPKILMNSGIGPRDKLMQANIEVKVENEEVGKNLQDHPAVGVTVLLDPAIAASFPPMYSLPGQFAKYLKNIKAAKAGTPIPSSDFGLLGSAGLSAGAFLASPYAENGTPDIQLTLFPSVTEPHLAQRPWSTNTTSPEELLNKNQMLITVALLNVEARYEVALNTSDPIDGAPDIYIPSDRSRYLSNDDVRILAWGVGIVRQIVATPPLSQLTGGEVSPGKWVTARNLEEWIHHNAFPNSHWVGTARMGSDDASVVDEKMNVRGVKGLRVADASIIPLIPNGNVHCTVVAMASICGDFIIAGTREAD